MVIKVKVSDVAAGFGVQNKEVLDLLAQCGAAKKSPSSLTSGPERRPRDGPEAAGRPCCISEVHL